MGQSPSYRPSTHLPFYCPQKAEDRNTRETRNKANRRGRRARYRGWGAAGKIWERTAVFGCGDARDGT